MLTDAGLDSEGLMDADFGQLCSAAYRPQRKKSTSASDQHVSFRLEDSEVNIHLNPTQPQVPTLALLHAQ